MVPAGLGVVSKTLLSGRNPEVPSDPSAARARAQGQKPICFFPW